jgi:hypothetical protein
MRIGGCPLATGCDQDKAPGGCTSAWRSADVTCSRLSLVSSQTDLPLAFQTLQDSTAAEPPRALFGRALFEADRLGPRPRSGPRWPWDDRRKESLRHLAALADFDPYVLRRAAFTRTRPTRRDKAAAKLLADATYYAWRAPLSPPPSPVP